MATPAGAVRTVDAMATATLPTRLQPQVRPTEREGPAPFPWVWVLAVACAKSAVQLSVAGRYGWHRDELYYVAAGQHPAAGYVDFPPVTPLLARVASLLFGDSLVGLRSFAVLAGAGVVVLAAVLARELGGGRGAQVIAAGMVAASPLLLGTNAMFQTVSFDQLAWAGVFVVAARLLRTGDRRLWPAAGVTAGVALTTKHTALVLLTALAVGLVATGAGRRLLRPVGPAAAAAGLAAVLVAPNLWWQATHGWASVSFYTGHSGPDSDPPLTFVVDFLLLANPVLVPLAAAGLLLLWRLPWARPLAWAACVVPLTFLLLGGKSYYAGPVWLLLLPAGATAICRAERAWLRHLSIGLGVVAAAVLIVVSPLVLPVLSRDAMVARGLQDERDDYAEELGWPELVRTVADVVATLPAEERTDVAIVARNYAEAGAVDLLGGAYGLPRAASTHLTYRYWSPPVPDAHTVVVIGQPVPELARSCRSLDVVATIGNDAGVRNEELGAPVAVCRLGEPFGQVWERLT